MTVTTIGILLILNLIYVVIPTQQPKFFILKACQHELYQSLPVDEEISGTYMTNNQLDEKDAAYDINLDCASHIPYPVGGSILLDFEMFEIEYDAENETCQWDQFFVDDEKMCGILSGHQMCVNGGSQVDLRLVTDDYDDEAYHGLIIHFHTSLTDQCTCMTLPKDEESAKPCVFPFLFRGIKYWNCVSDVIVNDVSNEGSFCATQVSSNGTLTAAGTCDENITRCKPVCRTEDDGRACVFPAMFGGVERHTCWQRWSETLQCSLVQMIDFQGERGLAQSAECGSQCDVEIDCDTTFSNINSGQFMSPGYNPVNTYPGNETCATNVKSNIAQNYYVTLSVISLYCNGQDFLEFKNSSSDSSAVYRFCGETKNTDFEDYSFCWTSGSRDSVEMKMQFQSGPINPVTNRLQLSGYVVKFKAADNSDGGMCQPIIESNDNACFTQNQIISSDYDILSFNYPRPYPADLFCKWEIEKDLTRPEAIPVVEIRSANLGVQWDSIEERDTITLQNDHRSDLMKITLENDDSEFAPFVMIGQRGSVSFSSSFYFNFHTNFNVTVRYHTVAANPEIFLRNGFCLNEDYTDMCHFPFTEEGENYTTCSKLGGDPKAWCKNYKDQKVHCETETASLDCLPPFADFENGSVSATTLADNSLRITWNVSNSNWDIFRVSINDQLYAEVAETEFITDNLVVDTSYQVKIQIVAFGREASSAQISFTPTGQPFGVFATSDSPGHLSVNWYKFPNDETSYQVSITPLLNTSISRQLFTNQTLASSVKGNVTSLDFADLTAGLEHEVKVEGFKNQGQEKTTEVSTSVYIPPRGFGTELNELSLHIVQNSGLELAGKLTAESYCEQITMSTKISGDNKGGTTSGLYTLTHGNFGIDLHVDGDNDYRFKSLVAVSETQLIQGAFYEVDMRGLSGDRDSKAKKISFTQVPGVVTNLDTISSGTTDLHVQWTPPTGQYLHFLVEVIELSNAFELINPTLLLNGLVPGKNYTIAVTTVTHNSVHSELVNLTTGTRPLPVSSFSAVRTHAAHPTVVTFQTIPPQRGEWEWMEIDVLRLIPPEDNPNVSLSDVEFPLRLTSAQLDLQVNFSKPGALYKATAFVVSEFNFWSNQTSRKFATNPLPVKEAALDVMTNDFVIISWSLSKMTSFFNRIEATVFYSNDLTTALGTAVIDVEDQKESGTMAIYFTEKYFMGSLVIKIKSISNFPDHGVIATSAETTINVDPVVPKIVAIDDITYFGAKVSLDVSRFGDFDIFALEVTSNDGISDFRYEFGSSACGNKSNCQVLVNGLFPDSKYTAEVSVIATQLQFSISSFQAFLTEKLPLVPIEQMLPDDNPLVSVPSRSLWLSVKGLPFEHHYDISQFSVIVASSEFGELLEFIPETKFIDIQHMRVYPPYTPFSPLPYPPLLHEGAFNITIGETRCVQSLASEFCNGYLKWNSNYTLWFAAIDEKSGRTLINGPYSSFKTSEAPSIVYHETRISNERIEFGNTEDRIRNLNSIDVHVINVMQRP